MRYLIAACLFSISLFSFTQEDKIPFKKYGVQEGLPEETIITIVQDDQGFIWLTTQLDAVRYDGYSFQNFGGDYHDPNGLHLQLCGGGMVKSKDGKLWIGGQLNGGIASFSPETKAFENYLYTPRDSSLLEFDNCYVLLEDSYQNIWFNNYSAELDSLILCRFDPKTKKVFNYPYSTGLRIANRITLNYTIAESLTDSSIWIIQRRVPGIGNLSRLNRETDEFELIHEAGSQMPGTDLDIVLSDIVPMRKSGLFVLSNSQYVFLWDPDQRKAIKHFEYDNDGINGWAAFEDLVGNIWVSSEGQILKYNFESNQTLKFHFGEGELDFDHINKNARNISFPTFQNKDGLWFEVLHDGPDSYLLYNYKDQRFYGYDPSFNYKSNDLNQNRSRFLVDFSGTKWFGTRPNIYKEDSKRSQLDLFKGGLSVHDLPTDSITYLFEDAKEQLWIGTMNGLCVFDDISNNFQQIPIGSDSNGPLRSKRIRSIFQDRSGRIWIATSNGIYRYDEVDQYFRRILIDELGTVESVSQDSKNQIWVSIINSGIYILDENGSILESFTNSNMNSHELTSNTIASIFHDSMGNTWLGDYTNGNHGIFKYNPLTKSFTQYQFANAEDAQIWWITEDKQGNVWSGSDELLKLYDPSIDSFISYGNNRDGFFSQTSYASDEKGNFWVGTYGGAGIVKVSAESGTYEIIGEEDGLPHSQILFTRQSSIPIDHQGNLYLATYRGLSIYNPQEKTFQNFTEKDGFQASNRSYYGITRKNGEVWIGGLTGLNRINPSKILNKKNSIPPKVWITSMTIMDRTYSAPDGVVFTKAVDYTDEIVLSNWQKDLSFDFVALHYLRPEDNQYSWKLEGYDDDWTNPSLVRTATYTNLAPGTYTFRVKGSNADGIWNEEGDFIKIIIHPPIWLTTVAFVLYGFIFVAGVYGVHRFQKARTIRKERELIKDQQLTQAKEIEKAYRQLKETQSQLIYSEKMASLGELTAGIAHEIQNPLNFVNNFSELNKELLDDLKAAVAKNNQPEVLEIIKALAQNEGKITQHGKRAEEIVKSMLQHSRASTGEKELTDINALADEYLRLAYHGLRAKDKSFNATFKAELDPHLPQIKVVPQEIGRVLLNLINNAFQAVKDVGKPEVVVKTSYSQSEGDTIVITISDNGPGIPGEIRDKIFQPFFTTKPTGQGTGLGLSMSYDIVTKGHRGALELSNEEEKGATFIMSLPLS